MSNTISNLSYIDEKYSHLERSTDLRLCQTMPTTLQREGACIPSQVEHTRPLTVYEEWQLCAILPACELHKYFARGCLAGLNFQQWTHLKDEIWRTGVLHGRSTT